MLLKKVEEKKDDDSMESRMSGSGNIKEFIQDYFHYLKDENKKTTGQKVHVDEVSSRVASFYENVRRVVDWKEEHLMRRMAIERVLKRRLFLRKKVDLTDLSGESMVTELIRGGHFPNDKIPRTKVKEIGNLLKKYAYILKNAPSGTKNSTVSQFYDRIFKTAACETEEILDPGSYRRGNIMIEFMEKVVGSNIYVGPRAKDKTQITPKQKEVQIFIAVQQALFNLDQPFISYNILKRYYPEWFEYTDSSVKEITKNVHFIFEDISQCFNHPLADKFYATCEAHDTPFLLLGDVIDDDPQAFNDNLSNPKEIKKMVLEAYNKRLGTLKKRVRRSAMYSTISVFATNIFSLYVVEIPLATGLGLWLGGWFGGGFNFISSLANIFVPTLLMVVLVATIKSPPRNNFELLIKSVYRIIYKGQPKGKYEIELYPSKSFILKSVFGLLYVVAFLICLTGIIALLTWLNFPPTSYVIFVIFTSLIMFTGSVIRKRSRELHMSNEKEGFLSVVIDPFILPIVYFGRWLSSKWQKYNIVAIFFVIMVDSPFFFFVEFLEQWRYFMKEKKEGIH